MEEKSRHVLAIGITGSFPAGRWFGGLVSVTEEEREIHSAN